MWLDGKDVNGDRLAESASSFLAGGKVGSWADRSGNANTLTYGYSDRQPDYLAGGGLGFSSGDWLTASTPSVFAGNPSFTAIIVSDATSSSGRFLNIANNGAGTDRLTLNANGGFSYYNGSWIQLNGSYNFYTTKSIGVWSKKSGSNFDKGEFKLNGTDKGLTLSGSADASGFNISTQGTSLTLGHNSIGVNADIYEVFLFADKLPDYTIKRMEGYLAHKWGSAANLPSGHPFKSSAPDFGGSQTIVTSGSTIPVVSSTPTLSFGYRVVRPGGVWMLCHLRTAP